MRIFASARNRIILFFSYYLSIFTLLAPYIRAVGYDAVYIKLWSVKTLYGPHLYFFAMSMDVVDE